MDFDTRRLARDAAILCAAISALGVVAWRELFFGPPIYELGDLAANAIQIDNAKHLSELVGHYSRWGFHHPGPAFLYVYAAGEIVLHDWLRLTAAPHNAHLAIGLVLESFFLGLGVATLGQLLAFSRRAFLAAGTAVAIAYLGLIDQPLFNLWPPTSLVLPFFLFVIGCAALAAGWIGVLPVVVGAGSFLVHGHAAQPLFVVPMCGAAYVWGRAAWRRRAGGSALRGNLASHVAALVVASPFVLTLALDAARGPGSNLAAILGSVGRGYHDLADVGSFISILASFAAPIEGILDPVSAAAAGLVPRPAVLIAWAMALGALPFVILRARRTEPNGPLASRLPTLLVYVAMALALVVLWVVIQAGEMYAFNGWFVYGLLLVVVLVWVGLGLRLLERAVSPATASATGMTALAVVGAMVVLVPVPTNRLYETGAAFHDAVGRLVADIQVSRPIYFDYLWAPTWPDVAGAALELHRRGYTFLVQPGHASVVLGEASAVEEVDLAISYPTAITWRFVDMGQVPSAAPLSARLEVVIAP